MNTEKVMNNFRTAFGSHFKAFDGCRRKIKKMGNGENTNI